MRADDRLHSSTESLGDGELVEQVCRGGSSAYDELRRRHSGAGRVVARALDAGPDADRLVPEAFERMRVAVRRGDRPAGGVRPYLIASIRTAAAERAREAAPARDVDPAELVDPASGDDRTLLALERTVTAQAFAGLPARWQEVLWYGVIESMPAADTALLIGETPHEVSDLLHRAREGLRRAWIGAHLTDPPIDSECRRTVERMYTRTDPGSRDHSRVKTHLSGCPWCRAVADDADQVADRLPLVLLPLTAGTAGAAAYSAWLRNGSPAVSVTRDASSATRPRIGAGTTFGAAGGLLVAAGLVAAIAFGPTVTSKFMDRLPVSSAEGRAAASPSATDSGGDEFESSAQDDGSTRARRSGSSPTPGAAPNGALGPFGPIGPTAGPRTTTPPPTPAAVAEPQDDSGATTADGVDDENTDGVDDDHSTPSGGTVSEDVVGIVDDSGPGAGGGGTEPTPAAEQPAPLPTPDAEEPQQPDTPVPPRDPRIPETPHADPPAAPTVSTIVAEPDGLVFPGLSGSALPGARVSIHAASDASATVPDLAALASDRSASAQQPAGGPAPLTSVVAGPDGTWVVPDIPSLGFGSHRLVATQAGADGVSSAPSIPVRIDLEALSIRTADALDRPGMLALSIGGRQGATVEISVDGEPVREVETTSRTTSSRVRLAALGEHIVSVRYRVVDADGVVRVGPVAETRVLVG